MKQNITRSTLLMLTMVSAVSCITTTHQPTVDSGKWESPEEAIGPEEDQNKQTMASEPHVGGTSGAPPDDSSCEGIPDKVDLSKHDTGVKAQYGGRCSAYGLIAAMENRARQLGLQLNASDKIDLSETHLFWAQRFKYASDVALTTASKAPIMDEKFWLEQNYSGLRRKILHRLWGHPDPSVVDTEGLLLERFTRIHQEQEGQIVSVSPREICTALRALAAGKPLYMALSVNDSLYRLDSPVEAGGPQTGGHAVAIVGYELKRNGASPTLNGTFLIKNSWGSSKPEARRTDGASAGYQNLPFSYCWTDDKYCGLWAIDSVKVEKVKRVFRP